MNPLFCFVTVLMMSGLKNRVVVYVTPAFFDYSLVISLLKLMLLVQIVGGHQCGVHCFDENE